MFNELHIFILAIMISMSRISFVAFSCALIFIASDSLCTGTVTEQR